MVITIPRFESKKVKRDTKLEIHNEKAVLIIDHTTDNVIGMVNLEATYDKNLELADALIGTIETFLENKQEEPEEEG